VGERVECVTRSAISITLSFLNAIEECEPKAGRGERRLIASFASHRDSVREPVRDTFVHFQDQGVSPVRDVCAPATYMN
jgi:hypothetical protein